MQQITQSTGDPTNLKLSSDVKKCKAEHCGHGASNYHGNPGHENPIDRG